MVKVQAKRSRIIADGMLRQGTPVQDYTREFGLWVKREDLACPKPGPPFSKTRGVYARVKSREEELIGVLDTSHSQAGHAVARACQILGKRCVNYYPEFKHTPGPKPPQLEARELGAELHGLPAGRSAILFHQARKLCEAQGGYMMPNALKLSESVTETARETPDEEYKTVIIPISSGTIAAGVVKGFTEAGYNPNFIIHMGYTRSHEEVERYIRSESGSDDARLTLVDEKYEYKDTAVDGPDPLWPCNPWYDLKAFRWWMDNRQFYKGPTLFWNIG